MAKPLLSSTFFSFPKLLLWSLPIGLLVFYTYLEGGLPASTVLLQFLQQKETWDARLASHVSVLSLLWIFDARIDKRHVLMSDLSHSLFAD